MTELFPQLRSYEVSIWTLLDEFISVLKESRLEKKGQILDPKLGIKDDGTLTFSFKIPMYIYLNGVKVENPNWYNTINGNLMITMRKIKVIFNKENAELKKIFEFIITLIEESHSQGQTYCEVSCEGLAFHELGKNGYKVSLSSDMFIKEYGAWQEGHARYPLSRPYREKDKPLATLDYWNLKIGLVNKRYLGKKVDTVFVKNYLKLLENAALKAFINDAMGYEETELLGITSDNVISGEEPFFDDLPVVRELALLISFDPTVYDTSNDSSSSNGEHLLEASLDDNTDLTPEEIEEREREKQRIVKILEKGVSYSLELDNISKTWAEVHGTFFPEPTEVSKIKLDGKNLYDVIGLLSFDETYYDTEQNSTYSVEYDLKESIGDEKDPSKIYHIVVNFNPKIEPYITIRNKSLVHNIVNDAKDQSYLPKYLDIEPINGMSLDDLEAESDEIIDSDSWTPIDPETGEGTIDINISLTKDWTNLSSDDLITNFTSGNINAFPNFEDSYDLDINNNTITLPSLTIEIPGLDFNTYNYTFSFVFVRNNSDLQNRKTYRCTCGLQVVCSTNGTIVLTTAVDSDNIGEIYGYFGNFTASYELARESEEIDPNNDTDEPPIINEYIPDSSEVLPIDEEMDTIIFTTYDITPDPHIWYYKVEMNYSGQSYSLTLEEELAREDPNEFHEEAETSADSGTTNPYTELEVGQFYRKSYKVYEESYVSSWNLGDGAANPNTVEPVMEKARLLDEQESNIYNLTQKIAETFGVFCRYEYEYDDNNHITCRTVVYYNNFLNEAEGLLGFTYPYQTTEISRNMDSTDLVTKMYVKSVDSSLSESGLITIMDAAANKSKEDYLLNFDYLYSIGTINSDLYKAIEPYEARLAELNAILSDRSEKMLVLDDELVDLKAKISLLETSIPLDEETINNNTDLLNELATADVVNHVFKKTIPLRANISNDSGGILVASGLSVPASNDVSLNGTGWFRIHLKNLVLKSIMLYRDDNGKKPITHFFVSNDGDDWLIYGLNDKWINKTIYIAYDVHKGYAALHRNSYNPELRPVIDKKITFKDNGVIATSIKVYKNYDSANNKMSGKIKDGWTTIKDDYDCASGILFKKAPNLSNVYVTYDYVPNLYYDKVISTWRKKLAQDLTNYDKYTNEREAKLAERDTYLVEYDAALAEKKIIIDNFVKLMGPALREGNWTPDDYEGKNFGNSFIDKLIISRTQVSEDDLSTAAPEAIGESGYATFIWDSKPFDGEQLCYYENGVEQEHIPYLCINLSNAVWRTFISQCLNGAFDSSSLGVGLCYYDNTIPALQAINYMLCYTIGSQSLLAFVRPSSNTNTTTIYPVLLLPGATVLTDDELSLMKNTATLGYFTAKSANDTISTLLSTIKNGEGKIKSTDWITLTTESTAVYPRIKINSLRMKDTTDELKVVFGGQVLKRFEEYTVLLRDGAYYITLKPEVLFKYGSVASNTTGMIFSDVPLYCGFKINTTDNAIYLDAQQILKENSAPKVSYNIKPTVFDSRFIATAYRQLGRIININDWELKFENVQGYISSLELDLDMPLNDSIEIKNYKTKFEDLFSSIVALTEEMKRTNFTTSGIVSNFNTDGSIKEDALTKLLEDNNALIMAYLNAHYAELTSATELLLGIFEEAGNIFASAVSAQTTAYLASLRNARILKSFARDVRKTITPSYTVSLNPPTSFKPGDMWVLIDENGLEIGHYLSMSDNLSIAGDDELSGWNKTYDGTLKSITGAGMEVDAEAGILTLEAESTLTARAKSNIYLASEDIQITGNSLVNIGGKYINIGAESGINLISSGMADLPHKEEDIIDVAALLYDNDGIIASYIDENQVSHPIISSVSLNSEGITMNSAAITMNAASTIDLIASNNDLTSAISIAAEKGVFIGANRGVSIFSSALPNGEVDLLAVAEFSGERIFLSHSDNNNNTTIFLMQNGELLLGATHIVDGLNSEQYITDLLNSNITGILITPTYIGMATGDNVSPVELGEQEEIRTLFHIKPDEFFVGTVLKETQNVDDPENPGNTISLTTYHGSGVKITGSSIEMQSSGIVDLRATNILLRGLNNENYFAVGNQVSNLSSFLTVQNLTNQTTGTQLLTAITNFNNQPENANTLIDASLIVLPNGLYTKNLYAESGKFSGELSGATGTFSGALNVGTGVTISGTSHPAFKVDNNGNLSIGPYNSSGLKWRFLVSSAGEITAIKGTIGGWTIGSDYIGNDNTKVDSSIGISTTGGYFLWAGDTTPSSAKFSVTTGGVLSAKGADISGGITATSLTLSGTLKAGTKDVTINGTTTSKVVFSVTKNGLLQIGPYAAGESGSQSLDYKFEVSTGGILTAKGATIEGKINATSGSFGDLSINSSSSSNDSVKTYLKLEGNLTMSGDTYKSILYLSAGGGNATTTKYPIRYRIKKNSSATLDIFYVSQDGDVYMKNANIENVLTCGNALDAMGCWFVTSCTQASDESWTITFTRKKSSGSGWDTKTVNFKKASSSSSSGTYDDGWNDAIDAVKALGTLYTGTKRLLYDDSYEVYVMALNPYSVATLPAYRGSGN